MKDKNQKYLHQASDGGQAKRAGTGILNIKYNITDTMAAWRVAAARVLI